MPLVTIRQGNLVYNKSVEPYQEEISMGNENNRFDIEDGVLKKYHGNESSVVIPEGVTEIGERAFEGCKALASVAIPEGVTEIGERAFEGCKALASVTIPASVTEIGQEAFSGCTSLA